MFGAFDRYNYGDNLMPILFEMYMNKYAKHALSQFSYEYVAIGPSELGRYSCYNTQSINNVVDTLPDGSVIVVIGGEVLCARNESMLLHQQDHLYHHLFLRLLKKLMPKLFSYYTTRSYSTQWQFPFIPSKKLFKNDVKVIFNTVGGDFSGLAENELSEVKERLEQCDYFSVRDQRTFHNMEGVNKKRMLAPDSAYIMSDLIDGSKFETLVSKAFMSKLPKGAYSVFQAAPHKVGCSVKRCIECVEDLAVKTGNKVVLLPIGYASGHHDFHLLQKINKALPNKTLLLNGLTIWEIMYVIVSSSCYFGTSLHGAITAMSFNIPHFGLNKKTTKLDAYLKDWSVAPFDKCYPVEDLSSLPELITSKSLSDLKIKTELNIEKVKENYRSIIEVIKAG